MADGVLLDYGMGNKSGSFSIRDAKTGKEVDFYIGNNIRSGGRKISCMSAPTEKVKLNPDLCEYWPPAIRAGSTRVKVTYWEMRHDEGTGPVIVKVSDQIEIAQ